LRTLVCWFWPFTVSGCSASYACFRRAVNMARSDAVNFVPHRFSSHSAICRYPRSGSTAWIARIVATAALSAFICSGVAAS